MAVETSARGFPFRLKRPGPSPVLIKELRSRMRGPRAFLILTGFLLLLSLVAFFVYRTMEDSFRFSAGPMSVSAAVGTTMFLGIIFFELFLIAFITPALTAGTISGEREAMTYEMLVATPLRPSSILLGKMAAALSYVFLLIFAAVPMLSLVFIFGGVTLRDMAVALLILVASAITFGTVGVFWSALVGRTGRATVLSYLTLLGFILGPYFVYGFWGLLQRETPPPALLYPSPFSAMESVIGGGAGPGFGLSGLPILGIFFGLSNVMRGGVGFDGGPQAPDFAHPAWHWTLALYALITVVLFMATILLVRPIGRRRVTPPQALLAIALVLGMLGGMSLVFSPGDWKQIWTSPGAGGMAEPGLLPVKEAPPPPPVDLPVEEPLPAEPRG